jgi:hyaluronoglucosaminidase
MCHRYGMDFSDVSSHWSIVQNSGDTFRGEHVVILYDPGDFPALLRDKHGNLLYRNGGVPQEGDLGRHLSKLRTQVDELVPDRNFQGEIPVHVLEFAVLFCRQQVPSALAVLTP